MKKIITIFILVIFLTSCQKNVFLNITKTDIDIVSEIHAINAKEYIEELILKLYKLNPIYIKKNEKFNKVSEVIIDIFKETDIDKVDKTGKTNINYILKGFKKDFKGDRIYYISKGLYGMINASYNYKNKFYVTDSRIDAQKLMNTAINIETLIWRLSNTRYNNVLLIKTNNINKEKINLNFQGCYENKVCYPSKMRNIIIKYDKKSISSVKIY